MKELSDKAVRDFALAKALNRVKVWGEIEDCNALRSELDIDLMPREKCRCVVYAHV
ncbi:hypothetical protein [Vibrio sp. YIC-376]|uniref:hypothetical protein n=1 Tax=Vibrio sp. YIC-376 TaxID=3136162 RepID=UPI00402A9002